MLQECCSVCQYAVLDDEDTEEEEVVELMWVGVGAARVRPATFRLTIIDNDGMSQRHYT